MARPIPYTQAARLHHIMRTCAAQRMLTDGTLLGWYRSKSMIAHDNDIDLSTLEEDMLKVWQNRHLLPDDIKMTCADPGRPEFNWCTDDECYPFDPSKNSAKKIIFTLKNIPPIPSNPVGYWAATVDLYTYRLEEDGYHNNYMFAGYRIRPFPESFVLPLQKSTFEGIDVFVPNKPKEWLEINYGYIGENPVWDEVTKLYKPRE